MAYNFLDKNFNSIGVLTNTGGQLNNYWGDQITHSIATSNDVLTSVSLSIDKATKNIDTNGNQKEWNHTIQGLSFGIDGIGKNVDELNYVVYQDGDQGHYYLMTITQVDESLTTSGFHFKTIQGINSAAYDLSRKTLKPADFAIVPTGTQKTGSAQNILKYIFSDLGWDVRVIGNFPSIDYTITDSVSAQSVLQDVIKLFDAEVDAHVLINNISSGSNVFTGAGSIKRVFEFSTAIGNDNGDVVRLNRNLVSLTKTGARDSLYTKLYVTGNDIDIAPANNGANFIYDDNANRKYNSIGANSTPVQYLEGVINNSEIKNPQALLTWGKKQLKALNHPRYNYIVTSINGKNVHLGDDVVVQDLKASQPIILKSKIISKTISFADPQTDSFILGEFSPIVIPTKNNDSNNIVQLVNKANQVATEALNKSENTQKGLSDLTDTVDKVQEQATQAVVSANGKNSIYTSRDEPVHPKEGDTWFWNDGTNSGIKVFTNGEWVDSVDTKTLERINNAVDSAIDTSKTYANDLNEKQVQTTKTLNEKVDKSVKELTDSQQSIASQATAYTNSAVADANSKAASIGQSAAQNAQSALDTAKKDFTSSFASQASQTASMASEANSKANQYANQAKSEAIAAATSADGVVRKEFKSTTDSMTATIQQNKSDADGKISTAQTTATQALDGLATKVEKTEYNQKTGELSSKINTTYDTAEQSKQDIIDIKETDSKQDNRMLEIEQNAEGIKQTVSDLSTEQGKQSGYISTLQQRADGFDATVTKVDNLAVGGRNLIIRTGEIAGQMIGFNGEITTWGGSALTSAIITVTPGKPLTMSGTAGGDNYFRYAFYDATGKTIMRSASDLRSATTVIAPADSATFRISYPKEAQVKLERGNIATDWTPAPEDLSSATAKAQLTADNATLAINNYKTDADGRISKAQADIVANANAITQKVSQSDYNTKTGELTNSVSKAQQTADSATLSINNYKTDADGRISKAQADIKVNADAIATKVAKTDYDKKTGDLITSVNKAQQTADTATQTIGTYKETNDKRVASAETNIKANSDAIKSTVSKTDFDKTTGKINGDISTLQQRADGFDATVTKVNNLSIGGRNLVSSTNQEYKMGYGIPNTTWQDGYAYLKLPTTVISREILPQSPHTFSYTLTKGTTYTQTIWFETDATVKDLSAAKITWFTGAGHDVQPAIIQMLGQNSYKVVSTYTWPGKTDNSVRLFDIENLDSAFNLNAGTYLKFGKLKLEKGNVATDWTPAPEDVDAQLAQVKITADGVYQTVNNPQTGLNTRVATAEGNINTIKSNVDGMSNKVTETADGLTREIADRKTGDSNTLQAGKDFTTSQITSYDTGMQSRLTQVSDGIMAQVSSTNLITDSSFVNATANWTLSGDVSWKINNEIMRKGVRVATFDNGSTNFDRKTSTLTSTPIYTMNLGGTQFYASVDIYAQSFGSSAYMKAEIVQKNSSGTTTKSTTIGGSFDKAMTDWNTYTADITLDPATTQLYLQVTQYGGGKVSIARPYLGSTKLNVGDYIPGASTDNTSTLKLFNNFFAFGIQSNTGALISGINGDSSGLNIVGKKITVSGDTTFIGKNFMDGAIIKNASIGEAQIADASITNAKISNLDVNKLSGNFSSFIQSNWNGRFGATTIDANGMTVDTSGIKTKFGSSGMTLNMTGESVGGIGVQGLTGKPSDYQGLTFWLDGNAEYMAWGARNDGATSGNPVLKLSWFRNTSAPSGSYAGFNFDDDVIFSKGINVPGVAKEKLGFTTKQFNGFNYPYFGDSRLKAGLAYGSGSTYLISGDNYYNLSRIIIALDSLGAVKLPSEIRSDGTVAKWFNVNL